MTVTVVNAIPRKQAEASQTTQYTATNVKAIIDKFTATNTTGAPVTFSVNLVASGGSATTANLVVSAKAIAAGECYPFSAELVGQVLQPGGFISTIASAATSLTISATVREIS